MNVPIQGLAPLSTGRRVLAIYLDLLVLSVPWALLHAGLVAVFPDINRFSLPIQIGLFVGLEILFHKVINWSPGGYLLSIHRFKGPVGEDIAGVDVRVKSQESWVTLFVGTLFLLEGCKGLVRWSMWNPPPPFFGSTLSVSTGIVAEMTAGFIECIVAYLIFKVNRAAVFVGTAYLLIIAVSTFASWDLWPDWAAESFRRRREYQGITTATPEELTSMRRWAHQIALGSVALYFVLLALVSPRLLRARGVKLSNPQVALPTEPQ